MGHCLIFNKRNQAQKSALFIENLTHDNKQNISTTLSVYNARY